MKKFIKKERIVYLLDCLISFLFGCINKMAYFLNDEANNTDPSKLNPTIPVRPKSNKSWKTTEHFSVILSTIIFYYFWKNSYASVNFQIIMSVKFFFFCFFATAAWAVFSAGRVMSKYGRGERFGGVKSGEFRGFIILSAIYSYGFFNGYLSPEHASSFQLFNLSVYIFSRGLAKKIVRFN